MNRRKRTARQATNDMRSLAKEMGLTGNAAKRFVNATAGKSIRETYDARRKAKGSRAKTARSGRRAAKMRANKRRR